MRQQSGQRRRHIRRRTHGNVDLIRRRGPRGDTDPIRQAVVQQRHRHASHFGLPVPQDELTPLRSEGAEYAALDIMLIADVLDA